MPGFEEIYNTYAPQVFRVCMGYVNDQEQAKDMVQDTFISVWKNLHSFRNESAISTWIFRIATNTCLRAIEKDEREKNVRLLASFPTADYDKRQDERLSMLYACIAALEEIERIIISLVLEDLPYTEIASIVGIGETNLRVKVHRIKQKLATKMKTYGQF